MVVKMMKQVPQRDKAVGCQSLPLVGAFVRQLLGAYSFRNISGPPTSRVNELEGSNG